MKKRDMHDEFVDELSRRVPRKADLISLISDILNIEKESIYRRLSGKVNFSVREMGILAGAMNISLDNLLYADRKQQWIPIVLESPTQLHSMDTLCERIDFNFNKIEGITQNETGETGNVYNSLPMEFFMTSPLIRKFMFFKWGNYFVKSEEFKKLSEWQFPDKLTAIIEKYIRVLNFRDAFYIWDRSLIITLVGEIENFYRMQAITLEEKSELKNELKTILTKLERTLDGTYEPNLPYASEMTLYVSSINVGFTSSYVMSPVSHFAMLDTNFSYSVIENKESFQRIKEWIKSLRNISILISKSGRIERRMFFESQHKIIDDIL